MNPELELKLADELTAVRATLIAARLRIVSILNTIAVLVGGGILTIHTMYPNAVPDFTASLSPTHKLIALGVWAIIVQVFIHRTKKAV